MTSSKNCFLMVITCFWGTQPPLDSGFERNSNDISPCTYTKDNCGHLTDWICSWAHNKLLDLPLQFLTLSIIPVCSRIQINTVYFWGYLGSKFVCSGKPQLILSLGKIELPRLYKWLLGNGVRASGEWYWERTASTNWDSKRVTICPLKTLQLRRKYAALLLPHPLRTKYNQEKYPGASLVAQWLRVCLPMKGTRVWALVWEDLTCCGATRPVSHNYWACTSGACAPQRGRPR